MERKAGQGEGEVSEREPTRPSRLNVVVFALLVGLLNRAWWKMNMGIRDGGGGVWLAVSSGGSRTDSKGFEW